MRLGFILKWCLIMVGMFVILTTVKFIIVIGILTLLVMLFFALRDKIRAGLDYIKRNIGSIFN